MMGRGRWDSGMVEWWNSRMVNGEWRDIVGWWRVVQWDSGLVGWWIV